MKQPFGLIIAACMAVSSLSYAGEAKDAKAPAAKPAATQTKATKSAAQQAPAAAKQASKPAVAGKDNTSAEEVACKDYAMRSAGKDGKLKFIGNAKEVVEKGVKTVTLEYAAVDYTKAERNYSLACSFDGKKGMNRVNTTQLSK